MLDKNPTTLIIDDDPDILKTLEANLRLHNFDVLTSENWHTGKGLLKKCDIVLLDIMLPDEDGINILKFIRKDYPELPVIMLTAKDRVSDRVMGLEAGADDYVVKPFETLELIARIRACLRRTKLLGREEIRIKNLYIDLQKREVCKDRKKIVLTPKEYELLLFLISRKGSVVSRKEIREQLWNNERIYSWSRVIDVHIQHLRHKIEDNPSEPEYILTVPGVGYIFKD